jgi:hypothetical protein
MRFAFSAMLAAATVVLAAGCSQEPPPPPEEIVAERAQARWDALLEGDYEAAWDYYSPGFRDRVSVTELASELGGRPFRYEGAEIRRVACEDQRCEVRVAVEFEIPSAPNHLSGFRSRQGIEEIWLFIDDQWWYSR